MYCYSEICTDLSVNRQVVDFLNVRAIALEPKNYPGDTGLTGLKPEI
jgi:hypothetical protein